MTNQHLNTNYRSLHFIKNKLGSLLTDLKLFIHHVFNNKFKLKKLLVSRTKLHFGSGSDIKEGFINIDISGQADIFLDARNRFNVPDNTIEYIYSSHFVEHLEHDDLIVHLTECYRMLKPGGILRLGVPDFPKVFRSYCDSNNLFLEDRRESLSGKLGLPSELITFMDCVNKAVYEFGEHKICLDADKIWSLLTYCGFDSRGIKQSEFDSDIDIGARRELTFFVEALK